MKEYNKPELLLSMERCGHFLYHRRGGKNGQNRILKILVTKGYKTQKELQEILDIQSGSISEIVMKMENKGLISREKDINDRRKIIIKVTQYGEDVFLKNIEEKNKEEQKLFTVLTNEEKKELQRILLKLLEYWTELL